MSADQFMNFEWDQRDRYLSNDGRGPLMARILCATDKTVTLERWHRKEKWKGKEVRFQLPLTFFLSPACGWQKTVTESASVEDKT